MGALVPATPGDLAHTIELRGFRLAARGRTHRFRSFRVRDLDKMAAQLQAAGIAVKIDAKSYPNGQFARLRDPEGNPIELWQPAKPATPR